MLAPVHARACAGVLFLGSLILLVGCVASQTRTLDLAPPAGLKPKVELDSVPFFAQEAYQCGPAALATVLNAKGKRVTPEALTKQVFLPARSGSLQIEMLAAARRHGMFAMQATPWIADLLAEVEAGNPVVVLQNLALSWYPQWHYAVVVGYDLAAGELVLRSGAQRRQVMALSTFEHTWQRSNYWAMIVTSPGEIPRTAKEEAYLRAAIALEQTAQPQAAEAAYAAALKRWPRSLGARVGLGNTLHARGDLPGAEAAFRQATLDHPQSIVAWNNLAETLAQQQRYPDALKAAEQAASLQGPNRAAAQATLKDIRAKASQR
jgi:tetratricopeptide (TPR) repeat protein